MNQHQSPAASFAERYTPMQIELNERHKERQRRLRWIVPPARVAFVPKVAEVARPPAEVAQPPVPKDIVPVYDPLTPQFAAAHKILEGMGIEGSATVKDIQRIVAGRYGVTMMDINGARRGADVILPRMIAVYLARELTGKSLPEIGRRFGGRDHTTILHSVMKIMKRIESDVQFAAEIDDLRREIPGAA